jgi:hypothetical protein
MQTLTEHVAPAPVDAPLAAVRRPAAEPTRAPRRPGGARTHGAASRVEPGSRAPGGDPPHPKRPGARSGRGPMRPSRQRKPPEAPPRWRSTRKRSRRRAPSRPRRACPRCRRGTGGRCAGVVSRRSGAIVLRRPARSAPSLALPSSGAGLWSLWCRARCARPALPGAQVTALGASTAHHPTPDRDGRFGFRCHPGRGHGARAAGRVHAAALAWWSRRFARPHAAARRYPGPAGRCAEPR